MKVRDCCEMNMEACVWCSCAFQHQSSLGARKVHPASGQGRVRPWVSYLLIILSSNYGFGGPPPQTTTLSQNLSVFQPPFSIKNRSEFDVQMTPRNLSKPYNNISKNILFSASISLSLFNDFEFHLRSFERPFLDGNRHLHKSPHFHKKKYICESQRIRILFHMLLLEIIFLAYFLECNFQCICRHPKSKSQAN